MEKFIKVEKPDYLYSINLINYHSFQSSIIKCPLCFSWFISSFDIIWVYPSVNAVITLFPKEDLLPQIIKYPSFSIKDYLNKFLTLSSLK